MMTSSEIHQIAACNDRRAFTLAEAEALFPLVRRLTQAAYQDLEPVRRSLEAMVPTNPLIQDVERQYEAIVKRWVGKMERLGLVDFDTGDGYLCWKFPELRIGHYHGYHGGYSSRVPLRQVVEEFDPDWAHA